MSQIAINFVSMQYIVAFALETLREKSPVGSGSDKHPGLYRDSHIVFIDGHNVPDASGWQRGQQVNIANAVPYARKIETGGMNLSVPAHVYEMTQPIVSARFGNMVSVKFVFMPVQFGSVQAYSHSLAGQAAGRRRGGSQRALADWLVRQPSLQINSR